MQGYYLGHQDAMSWAYLFVFICMFVNVWFLYLAVSAFKLRLYPIIALVVVCVSLILFATYRLFASYVFDNHIIQIYIPLSLIGLFITCWYLRKRQRKVRELESDIVYDDFAILIQNVMTFLLCLLIWFVLFVCCIRILNANDIYEFLFF